MNFVGLNVYKFESQLNPYRRVRQAISWKIGQLENELVSKLIIKVATDFFTGITKTGSLSSSFDDDF